MKTSHVALLISKRVVIGAIVAIVPALCLAKSPVAVIASSNTMTFGVESVAIIANNPLYGLKSTVGWVKGYFAPSDPKEKTLSEVSRLDQSAAELVKASQVGPKNAKLMLKAMTEYQIAVYNFTIALSKSSLSSDQQPDENFARGISQAIIRHARFIDEMNGWKYLTNAHQALLRDITDRFEISATTAIETLIGAQHFLTIANQDIASLSVPDQIRLAEVFSVLAKAAAHNQDDELARLLLTARIDLLASIASSSSEEVVSTLSSIAGSESERLQTAAFFLTTNELKENQQLVDLRNQLLIKMF
jgi:hypothetical protein